MGGRVSSPTFVGRIEELKVLEAAWVRAADAEPAVVLLGGEAGVGKTRLVAELTARCAGDRTQVLAGGCVPAVEAGLPYAPIVEALRGLLADLGADTLRGLIGPSWPELARLVPGLGEVESTTPPGQDGPSRVFELLLGLLRRLTEQAPRLVVVEDLHWADRSTRDLVAFLARNLRRERILLVVTYRSDETGRARLGPYLAELDRSGRVDRIELPRFQRAEVMAQLAGILRAAPAGELLDVVFARAEGNAFFTEELLAAVRAGSRELPMTLQELLGGRVEELSHRAQEVLGAAAVAGRRVPHRLLAVVAAPDDSQLDAALRQAVAHQLLVTRPDQDGYEFRHARSKRSSTLVCCRESGPACTPGWPPPWPPIPAGRVAAPPRGRPSWPTIGSGPVTSSGPCRSRSRPPPRRSGPTPWPRPTGTTSVLWSCGTRCRRRPSWSGWIWSPYSSGPPRRQA
jgi:predicted ATPase